MTMWTAEQDEDERDPDPRTGTGGVPLPSERPATAHPTGERVFPAALRAREWWVAWILDGKGRKRPVAPWQTRHLYPVKWRDSLADDDRPETDFETMDNWVGWDTDHTLPMALPDDAQSDTLGRGLILPKDRPPRDERVVLIDWDDVRNPETGAVHPAAAGFIERYGGYVEVSQSGEGLHQFVFGALPPHRGKFIAEIDGEPFVGDDRPKVEIYDGGRHVALTGRHVAGTDRDLVAGQACVDAILDTFGDDTDAAVAAAAYHAGGGAHAQDADRDHDHADNAAAAAARDFDRDQLADAYDGWGLDRLAETCPDDRDLGYHAVVVAFYEGSANVLNWKLEGAAAAYGAAHELGVEQVVADLRGDYLDSVATSAGFDHKTAGRIRADYDRARRGEFHPHAWDTLAAWGVLPPRILGGDDADDDGLDTPDPAHVAVLADTDAGREWWRADTRGDDGEREASADELSQATARERTQQAIATAYERPGDTLVEAMPAAGKSYGAIAAAAETDEPITFLTGRGVKEQYAQVTEWCDEHGLSRYRLPSFTRHCDTANGEHGQEWKETVNRWYRRGATPKQIHAYAETHLGEPLPCQRHDGQQCPFTSLWDFDPDDYDVLIGHYTHAHVPSVVNGRSVVIDESPGDAYETTLTSGLQPAVSYWLSQHDAIPYDDYTDLIEHRDDSTRRADTLAWFLGDDGSLDAAEGYVFEDDHAHAAAPLAVFALAAGDDLGNGFERADLRDAGLATRNRATGALTLLRPPDFEYARRVVALDGTPTPEMWETALGTSLTHREVLADDDRARFLRGLDLTVVQTTDAIKSYSAGESEIRDRVSLAEDTTLLEAIADQHGTQPGVITTARAEGVYEEAGVFDAHATASKHYGNVLGSNTFASTRVGAVLGARNFGPDYVKKWCAYLGETANPTFPSPENDFAPTDYGPTGNKIRTHMREHETLQAAMRFGRDGNGAVVYVHTAALPDWVPREHGEVVQTWSDGMQQVLTAAADLGEWTTAEVTAHPAVDLSRQQVFDHLETLHDRGLLDRDQDPADGRRYLWHDDGLHRVGENGAVELPTVEVAALSADEVRKLARITTYRWEFTNFHGSPPPADRGSAVVAENGGGRAARGAPPVPTGGD